jgi:hypothetical protein
MLEESEVRAIAQKVIDQSKSSARVDTGALRRSGLHLHSWRCYLRQFFTVNLVITQARKKRY